MLNPASDTQSQSNRQVGMTQRPRTPLVNKVTQFMQK